MPDRVPPNAPSAGGGDARPPDAGTVDVEPDGGGELREVDAREAWRAIQRLRQLKREGYRTLFTVVMVVLVGYLVVAEVTGGRALDRSVAALLLSGVALAWLDLLPEGRRTRRAEVVVLATLVASVLGGLAVSLFATADPLEHERALLVAAAWLPIVVLWTYVAFGRRVAWRVALGVLVSAAVVVGMHVLLADAVAWRALGTLVLVGALQLVGLHVLTGYLERRVRWRALADVAAGRAFVDPVTGLPDRRRFMDRLERAVAQARRAGGRFAVAFVDLDGFKAVNDAYGQRVGDELLRVAGARLADALRGSDTVARLGGDEFAVLTGGAIDDDGAAVLAEKLVAACTARVEVDGRGLRVAASVGVARFPDDGTDADALVRVADAALEAAKWGGAGRVQIGPVGGARSPRSSG
ncbi:MAG: GGDEF domain-containing protein [Trueperaceae bacterium]|nr:GGDEF domain-containing protein [Trueperaceae bacterium]